MARGTRYRYRSARTGRFVRPWVNRKYPNSTIRERV